MQRSALRRSEGAKLAPRAAWYDTAPRTLSRPNLIRTEARVLTSLRPTLCRPNPNRNRRITDNRQMRAGRPIEAMNSMRLENLDKLRKSGDLHRVSRKAEIGEPAQRETPFREGRTKG